ncbi:putative CCR4-associated factor 1-like protein 11 [Senna tora]|uniref:Putative CCR4-associated factor 1-like protein 11 n=1 Tax=Senna tora TaxID=362788 RepID=A0A834WZ75_9FABA|nr:putative CCR4-associated factor 1-like protein 11 [Senna tora]
MGCCLSYLVSRGSLSGSHDFGYLMKILIGRELPYHLHEFNSLVVHYFGPRIYDMKHMMKFCNGLYGGLESLAKTLKVDRVTGKSHQAGSNSRLTLETFMKLKDVYFEENYGQETLIVGVLHGLEMNRLNPVHLSFNKFCSLLRSTRQYEEIRYNIALNCFQIRGCSNLTIVNGNSSVLVWIGPTLSSYCVHFVGRVSRKNVTILENHWSISKDEVHFAINVTLSIELSLRMNVQSVLTVLNPEVIEPDFAYLEVGESCAEPCLSISLGVVGDRIYAFVESLNGLVVKLNAISPCSLLTWVPTFGT